MSGYTGGQTVEPGYQDVCSGSTGHAEAVQISFDPAVISFDDLVTVFWSLHNPTQFNKQGGNVGSQYRSAIFYNTDEQAITATASKATLDASNNWSTPVVTEITAASTFFHAEEYHQRYYEKNGMTACKIVLPTS